MRLSDALWHTDLPGLPPPRRGKVRDVYDLGGSLLIVASDRLSAYDHVLRPGIPGKGKILNQLSNFWFSRLAGLLPNHLLATEPEDFPESLASYRGFLRGRAVLARKARVVPFECVARGFLAGSGYREYVEGGEVCGIPLPPGLQRASRLPEPIFTPATKATSGHDVNISEDEAGGIVGRETIEQLRNMTLRLYSRGAAHAEHRGIIVADTKFEFGRLVDGPGKGEIILIDEVLTPDSSRFWPRDLYAPGGPQPSYDKQFVRDYLDSIRWNKQPPVPSLPDDVVEKTRAKYIQAFHVLTGLDLE
jgi:phosphoribosylaminoimidazole-succinocarboxamide synthase